MGVHAQFRGIAHRYGPVAGIIDVADAAHRIIGLVHLATSLKS